MVALIAAGVGAAGAIGGSLISSSATSSAADKAAAAQKEAAALQDARYQQTRNDLMPFQEAGKAVLPQFQPLYDTTSGNLDNTFSAAQSHIPENLTQAELLNQPGYQFALREGQKQLANSLAGRGLSGLSGTQAKSAMSFGTGLASQNWNALFNQKQQIFGDYNQQFANRANQGTTLFNQLSSRATLGENAANQTGVQGTLASAIAGNNIAGAGQSIAGGQIRSGDTLGNGFAYAGNALSSYLNSPAGKSALSGIGSSPTYASLDPTGQSIAPASYYQ